MRTPLGDSSEPRSSYPSLSLPAQPVAGDLEAICASFRSKKPTRFFGDPLSYSFQVVEEDQSVQSTDPNIIPPIASSPRKQLIRDRPPITMLDVPSHSFAEVKKTLHTD